MAGEALAFCPLRPFTGVGALTGVAIFALPLVALPLAGDFAFGVGALGVGAFGVGALAGLLAFLLLARPFAAGVGAFTGLSTVTGTLAGVGTLSGLLAFRLVPRPFAGAGDFAGEGATTGTSTGDAVLAGVGALAVLLEALPFLGVGVLTTDAFAGLFAAVLAFLLVPLPLGAGDLTGLSATVSITVMARTASLTGLVLASFLVDLALSDAEMESVQKLRWHYFFHSE